MTAIHLPSSLRRSAHHRAAVEALGDTSQWIVGTVREWRRRVRERQELAGLDERMLADIGLTPGDAEFLVNKPFWRA